MAYARDVINRDWPKKHNYRTKEEMLDVFDSPSSRERLTEMIENYNKNKEGIMALVTDYGNATYFITFKLSRVRGSINRFSGA